MVVYRIRNYAALTCLASAMSFGIAVSLAQESAEPGAIAAEKAELKEFAANPEVQADLEEPDGISIADLETDNWKIFARGTGTYEFNDPDDRKDATEEAILEAKAALAKFMKERVATESQMDKLAEEESRKSKTDGVTNVAVTKTRMKTTLNRIHNSADEILSGIITLETTATWDGNSGEVRVTVAQSEKSLAAAEKVKTRTGNSVIRAEQSTATGGPKAGGSGVKPGGVGGGEPSTIKRKSKTAL
jgi:hypothetical protein